MIKITNEEASKIMKLDEHKGTEPHKHPHEPGEFPGEDPNAPAEEKEVEITESTTTDKKNTFGMAPFKDLKNVADAALKIMTKQPQEVKEEEVTKEDQPQQLTE